MLRIPQKMVGVVQAAFSDGQRDPNGPIGVVGVTRVAGEIASSNDISFVQGPRARELSAGVRQTSIAAMIRRSILPR